MQAWFRLEVHLVGLIQNGLETVPVLDYKKKSTFRLCDNNNQVRLLHVTMCETPIIKSWSQSVSDHVINLRHVRLCTECVVNQRSIMEIEQST